MLPLQALLSLEELIAGLDIRDDMAVLLDQALSPTLTFLRSGDEGEKLDAVTLLGSICEKRSGAAAFLVAEGALPAVAQLLIAGEAGTHVEVWRMNSESTTRLQDGVSCRGC